jgi:hypothetical protein
MSGMYLFFIAYLSGMIVAKKNNGDNILRDEKRYCLNDSYFDYASIPLGLVSFPLDIENYRHDRQDGYIQDIGLVMRGKYKGKIGAMVLSEKNHYLCPLDQLTINGTFDRVLASRRDEIMVKAISRDSDRSDIVVIGNEGKSL